jgi:MOSC domain-containing protein YiiM
MKLLTVNVGRPKTVEHTDAPGGATGIDKKPADGAVRVMDPGPKGEGASGVAGDTVCDLRHHGGTDQAVYAFAREDLDFWERELGRPLGNGAFGENLTTSGLDVSGAKIGERWRIGGELVLEVTSGRIPCRTFASWLGEKGWVKRFTRQSAPGAYLRVIEPGEIRAGDPIEVRAPAGPRGDGGGGVPGRDHRSDAAAQGARGGRHAPPRTAQGRTGVRRQAERVAPVSDGFGYPSRCRGAAGTGRHCPCRGWDCDCRRRRL